MSASIRPASTLDSRPRPTAGLSPSYRTGFGRMYTGETECLLQSTTFRRLRGRVQLLLTSPPFPLNRKKAYGNFTGDSYLTWLEAYAQPFTDLLTEDGSIVMEIGNSWDPGQPTMATLGLRALLAFMDKAQLHLCQQFVCHNPARLPSPIQWVNIERVRAKDSFTHVWWMAKNPRPKADNRRVLRPYSDRMMSLLKRGKYNSGLRPSEHGIGKSSFLTNNGGAIPSNVLSFSNTHSNDVYQAYCRTHDLTPHPARMPAGLAEFFINLTTERGNLVLDPFAGSNTTGAAAERLKRRWICIEANAEYVAGSRGRFIADSSNVKKNGR